MLLNFEFENYKSYRENNVINMNGEKSCLIVGEELSGKTNAIEALICCISHIISPIHKLRITMKNFLKYAQEMTPSDSKYNQLVNPSKTG